MPPHPVQVCRLTPASPKAGGIRVAPGLPSARKALPSRKTSASNLPGPHMPSTCRSVSTLTPSRSATGCSFGARRDDRADVQVAIGPAVEPAADARRQRIVHRRMTQRALDADGGDAALPSKNPVRPTTASSRSRARVTAGSSRFTFPRCRAAMTERGRLSTSTLSPAASAAFGADAGSDAASFWPAMAWCSLSVSPQYASSPKVSYRRHGGPLHSRRRPPPPPPGSGLAGRHA